MTLLFILCYRVVVRLKTVYVSSLPDFFHFQANGNYFFQTNENTKINFLVCTKEEYKQFQKKPDSSICSESGVIYDGTKSGEILESGTYQILFYMSNGYQNTLYEEVNVTLKNPKSFLDANVQPCLISKPLFGTLAFISLAVWAINWCCNFSLSFTIHEYITILFIDTIIYQFVYFSELIKKNKSDDFTILTPIRMILIFSFQLILFSTILMAAKGWCIVHRTIGKLKIAYCFLVASLLTLPQCLLTFGDYGNWDYIIIMVGLAGVTFFYRDLIVSIDDSSTHVVAHLVVISESGIDPSTTPVMEKFMIFKALSWGILLYLVAQLVAYFFMQFLETPYYIAQIFSDTVNLCALIGAGYLFRLTRERITGFVILSTEEESPISSRIVSIDEIRDFNMQNVERRQGKAEWETGMALPPIPFFNNDNNNHTIHNTNPNFNSQHENNQMNNVENNHENAYVNNNENDSGDDSEDGVVNIRDDSNENDIDTSKINISQYMENADTSDELENIENVENVENSEKVNNSDHSSHEHNSYDHNNVGNGKSSDYNCIATNNQWNDGQNEVSLKSNV
ncbi:hypothetical protein TRFO_18243 [Tritrichomonas foetus]|uniref:Intimal thickness related receptor IRP domain-containing protein n=1 Tax=Tritrichomonas foetus TaxID=1144522 RepID=A0A1J4KLE9_9EUKA|nr:hypothetical protein TRFO_18243 [Tritrichomonas foetus]|eukprot:OHT12051.1 hypothetical protein TRFO_18243 [Tritrichomonas foetus]